MPSAALLPAMAELLACSIEALYEDGGEEAGNDDAAD